MNRHFQRLEGCSKIHIVHCYTAFFALSMSTQNKLLKIGVNKLLMTI